MNNRNRDEKKLSLVLSIFKGENFVCKNPAGFRCQIEAKCFGQTLESGVISVPSSNSEPSFNFQLAWHLTKQELKEIRGNKEPVKVKCLILNEDSKTPTELGYAVLHVKNAFVLSGVEEVDPTKANLYLLLGTQGEWKNYHPKLQMQLHIEDYSQTELMTGNPGFTRKVKSSNNNNAAPSVPKIEPNLVSCLVDCTPKLDDIPEHVTGEKFRWRINEDDGCFELGTPSSSDDLYILNITIISASYLHHLWNGRSPKKASDIEYVWQVKYKAYGCEIKSDPFILSHDDENSRRTFIGDKATARIRAHPALFCDYLQQHAVEFHVIRFELDQNNALTNEEIMGVSFAELNDLAKPKVKDLKVTLEIVSEWGYPRVGHRPEKPEVRVVFQLEAMPGFFNVPRVDTCKGCEDNPCNCKGDENPSKNELEKHLKSSATEDGDIKGIVGQLDELQIENDSENPVENQDKLDTPVSSSAFFPNNKKITESSGGSLTKNKQNNKADIEDKEVISPQRKMQRSPPKDSTSSSSSSPSASTGNTNADHTNSDSVSSGNSPDKIHSLEDDELSSSINSDNSTLGNLKAKIPKPGTYEITIGLSKFWLKSKAPLTDEVVLSYIHPKFGIVENAVMCSAKPSAEKHDKKPHYQCMDVIEGASTLKVAFPRFSEKVINEPLTVEFRKYTKKFMEPVFAFSMIPVGYVLLQGENNGARVLKGTAEILKSGTNIRIGKLHYSVKFVAETIPRVHKRTLNQPSPHRKGHEGKGIIDSEIVFHTLEELNSWKSEQKSIYLQELKQKERAYLQILAEEAAERDKQRESVISERLKELKKKEKSLNQQLIKLADREQAVKSLEMELATSNQKISLDSTSKLENAKLTMHRMQEEHKIEVASLQRRNEDYKAELEKYKGKLSILERKLDEKEEIISKLKSERNETMDARFPEKMKLEHENKLLKKQIIETERSRDQYKKQSQTLCHKLSRLQEERDKQLKDENENLRLQIIASKEHKELKKERKAVNDLSQTIRTLQDKSNEKSTTIKESQLSEPNNNVSQKGRKSATKGSNEDEILRLTQMRNGLLNTGAYTQYDMVIKEMERRIVGLAERDPNN